VTGSARPVRIEPGPGQESVWDYPRPPRIEAARQVLRVELARVTLAETVHGLRVLETGSPPTYYFPPDDVRVDLLEPSPVRTICEWKGVARHWNARVGERLVEEAAWSYRDPKPGFEPIAGYLAFYAGKMDSCWVGTEKAIPQPGSYYGGWITSRIVGPFKGVEGTDRW
jgi:uncharacterized protein (DUF427 family)